eukprot:g31932.t1
MKKTETRTESPVAFNRVQIEGRANVPEQLKEAQDCQSSVASTVVTGTCPYHVGKSQDIDSKSATGSCL